MLLKETATNLQRREICFDLKCFLGKCEEMTAKTNSKAEVDLFGEVNDDDDSGAESFLTDDEVHYQQGLDPVEDEDAEDEENLPDCSAEMHRNDKSTHCAVRSRSPESQDRSRSRSRSPKKVEPQSWKSDRDPDWCPQPIRFTPARPPGHPLKSTAHTHLWTFSNCF